MSSKVKAIVYDSHFSFYKQGKLVSFDYERFGEFFSGKKFELYLSSEIYNVFIEPDTSAKMLSSDELMFYVKTKYIKSDLPFTYRLYKKTGKLFVFYPVEDKIKEIFKLLGKENVNSLKLALFTYLDKVKNISKNSTLFSLTEGENTVFLAVREEPIFFRKKRELYDFEKEKELEVTLSFLQKSEKFSPEKIFSDFPVSFSNAEILKKSVEEIVLL